MEPTPRGLARLDRDSRPCPKFHGHIPFVPPGSTYSTRSEVSQAGLHGGYQSGIFGTEQDGGAFSVVMSGAYPDGDGGDILWYTGAGGRTCPATGKVSKRLTGNQNLSNSGNKALNSSYYNRRPVRVIRGSQAVHSPWAPEEGYRYDGLYRVTRVGDMPDPSGETDYTCMVYRMERIVDGYQVPVRIGHERRAARMIESAQERKQQEDRHHSDPETFNNLNFRKLTTAPRPRPSQSDRPLTSQSTSYQNNTATQSHPATQGHQIISLKRPMTDESSGPRAPQAKRLERTTEANDFSWLNPTGMQNVLKALSFKSSRKIPHESRPRSPPAIPSRTVPLAPYRVDPTSPTRRSESGSPEEDELISTPPYTMDPVQPLDLGDLDGSVDQLVESLDDADHEDEPFAIDSIGRARLSNKGAIDLLATNPDELLPSSEPDSLPSPPLRLDSIQCPGARASVRGRRNRSPALSEISLDSVFFNARPPAFPLRTSSQNIPSSRRSYDSYDEAGESSLFSEEIIDAIDEDKKPYYPRSPVPLDDQVSSTPHQDGSNPWKEETAIDDRPPVSIHACSPPALAPRSLDFQAPLIIDQVKRESPIHRIAPLISEDTEPYSNWSPTPPCYLPPRFQNANSKRVEKVDGESTTHGNRVHLSPSATRPSSNHASWSLDQEEEESSSSERLIMVMSEDEQCYNNWSPTPSYRQILRPHHGILKTEEKVEGDDPSIFRTRVLSFNLAFPPSPLSLTLIAAQSRTEGLPQTRIMQGEIDPISLDGEEVIADDLDIKINFGVQSFEDTQELQASIKEDLDEDLKPDQSDFDHPMIKNEEKEGGQDNEDIKVEQDLIPATTTGGFEDSEEEEDPRLELEIEDLIGLDSSDVEEDDSIKNTENIFDQNTDGEEIEIEDESNEGDIDLINDANWIENLTQSFNDCKSSLGTNYGEIEFSCKDEFDGYQIVHELSTNKYSVGGFELDDDDDL